MRRPLVLAFLIAPLVVARQASADHKTFPHVYPYFTQPKGGLELEWWVSAETRDLSHLNDSTYYEHRIELEYGLTDHWDVSLYQIFTQEAPETVAPAQSALRYDGFRVETRYRFAEKGDLPVDTEVYGEIERPADLTEPFELENKLILGKDVPVGPVTLLFQENLINEWKLASGEKFGYFLGADGGAGIELNPVIRLGGELLLERTRVNSTQPAQDDAYAGPAISLGMPRGYLAIGAAFHFAGSGTVEDQGHAMRFRLIYAGDL
jgi:hypothetical protein